MGRTPKIARRFGLTVLVLSASLGQGLAGSAAAQSVRVIALEPLVSKISAYRGVLVWSHWDRTASVYRLMARYRGRTELVPIAPRSVAFDVELGPDPRGRAVAVYSRCRQERPVWTLGASTTNLLLPGGCVLYRYDFTARSERHIAGIVGGGSGSFYLPAIWRNEISYVRVRGGSHLPALFEQPLSAPRRQRIIATALPGGTPGAPGPVALSLRGRALAFAWDSAGRSQFDSGIYLDTVSPRARTAPRHGSRGRPPDVTVSPRARTAPTQVLAEAESSDNRSPGLLGFPAFDGASLFYGRFDGSGITPNNDAFERVGPGGGSLAQAAAPHALRAQAHDSGTTFAMYGQYVGSFSDCGLAGCALIALSGTSYR